MANLTVDEARVRAELITVTDYDVALDLDTGPSTFTSRATIRFESSSAADTFVELVAAQIHELFLDGEPINPESCADDRVPLTVTAGAHTLTAHATMTDSNDGEGMHHAVDPVDDEAYLYAMSFLDAAPRIFCCFDQPDLKAPYRFSVRTPEHWTVIGNAPASRGHDGTWRLATRARASLPDPEAKARAWQRLTADHAISNYELYANAEGFWQPEQTELTAPYVERYFAEIPATERFRSGWLVAESARLAFPVTAVDAATLRLATVARERSDLTPGLRRALSDSAADLDRALRVREWAQR